MYGCSVWENGKVFYRFCYIMMYIYYNINWNIEDFNSRLE